VSKDSARSGLSSDRNELFMVCVKVVGFQKLVWNVGCCFAKSGGDLSLSNCSASWQGYATLVYARVGSSRHGACHKAWHELGERVSGKLIHRIDWQILSSR